MLQQLRSAMMRRLTLQVLNTAGASILIPDERSLRPVKNRGGEVLLGLWIKTLFLMDNLQNLTKLLSMDYECGAPR